MWQVRLEATGNGESRLKIGYFHMFFQRLRNFFYSLKIHLCLFAEGELKHIKTGEGFVFKMRDEHDYNQKRYEAIGEVLISSLLIGFVV